MIDERPEPAESELAPELASLPRAIEPERDLWPEIEPRLRGRSPTASAGTRVLAIGLALAAAAAAAAWWWPHDSAEPAPLARAPADPAPVPAPAPAEPSELVVGESDYRRAADLLGQAIEARHDALSPELATIYDHNLEVVDAAIASTRAALARDPDDAHVRELLDDAYRRKLDLLEQVAAVPGRS